MFILNKTRILIGTGTLIIGAMIYFVSRPPDQIYFFYYFGIQKTLYSLYPVFLKSFCNILPSFFHVLAFILLTAGFTCCQKRGYLIISLWWLSIDIIFELGQNFKIQFSNLTPGWFESLPFLENTRNYFLHGTFDISDLAVMIFGAIIAYVILLKTEKSEVVLKENI